ncbi:tail fiber domain-containing protein [Cellulosimicrobium sp. JZ28]|uniref:tail fiber domain-containing protein n=1 Tax=Cellulosimicrobium sp. JZ28 TaxID=1906273 RepID=UPI00188B4939|nr:tail fiber domain-containing protein [Cellulosimicrobium sp. JZ28]
MADDYSAPGEAQQYRTPRAGFDVLAAELASQRRRLSDQERAKTLGSAAISDGGLVVKDGGSVTIRDGGGVAVEGGGSLAVADGGGVDITGGGSVAVRDGGGLRVEGGGDVVVAGGDVDITAGGSLSVRAGGRMRGYHPDGSLGAQFGPLVHDGTGDFAGVGLLIQGPASDGAPDVLKAKTDETGARTIEIGQPDAPIQDVWGRSQRWWLRAAQSSGTGIEAPMRLTCAGEIGIYSETGRLRVPWTNASSAANVALDPDGIILRVSSALKYKQDVEDYDADPDAVLALRPRSWRDRGEVERDPDTSNRYVGFIAEEVHAAGLTNLVVYDADGHPDALSYDRFSAALLAVIRRQQTQIDTMRAELDELLRARLPEEAP